MDDKAEVRETNIETVRYNNFYVQQDKLSSIEPEVETALNDNERNVQVEIDDSEEVNQLVDKRRTELVHALYTLLRSPNKSITASLIVKTFADAKDCTVKEVLDDIEQLRDPTTFYFHKTTLQQQLQKLKSECSVEIGALMDNSEYFSEDKIIYLSLKYKCTPRKIAQEIKRNKAFKTHIKNFRASKTKASMLSTISRYVKVNMIY